MSSETELQAASRNEVVSSPSRYQRLRIWPPLLLLGGMAVTRYLPRLVEGGSSLWMLAVFGPIACGALILLWWLLASRATWKERLVGFFGAIAALVVTILLVDRSMRGPGIMVLTVPMGTIGFAVGAVFSSRVLSFRRTLVALLLAIIGFGFSTALRSDGLWGNFAISLHWRWTPSSDEIVLRNEQHRRAEDVSNEEVRQALRDVQWPGFRGPGRDGHQHGPAIATDWDTTPPELLWKVPVGPGWSSFAVAGNLLFTQEQRGAYETTVCYAADSGREVWTHRVESRFDDPLGGPGPRATPTLVDDGLFVMGSTGFLTKLNATSGEVLWQQDLREVAGCQPPIWGFASSPLVAGSVVIVYAGGAGDKGVLAFENDSGRLKWSAAAGDQSYSSPQLATMAGEHVVLMLTNAGLHVLDPETGTARLGYEWNADGYRALQPQAVGADAVLIASGMSAGVRLVRIAKTPDGLKAEEGWKSPHLKPDFNDLVVDNGHAYGFDGAIFTCIDLDTGRRMWKGGRYGKGQVLLLADSGMLLVAGEQGEVVLLKADPSKHVELAKFQALDGKTWNHPVLIGDRLFVRNSQQAACYRLPLAIEMPTRKREAPSE